uniref:Sugar ABC transporter permease n=1 Tax=Haemonchus contortus TaxID=6289 RepID=A0A7I5E7Q9_HAECO
MLLKLVLYGNGIHIIQSLGLLITAEFRRKFVDREMVEEDAVAGTIK